ncbi:MAG: AarF/UbiB family protein [Myxococcota bacterium]
MPGTIGPLGRREIAKQTQRNDMSAPSMMRTFRFEAGWWLTVKRLFLWLAACLRFLGGTLLDAIKNDNTIERRAVRLRQVLEGLGPTFIKLGQQASVRADLLPYAYCEELAKMLDRVKPFDTAYAIAAIERQNQKKVTDLFAHFDPEPIGSASLSCVYQAILPSGEKVAVKVRRPHVVEMLAADLRALGWLMDAAETLSLVRSGMTRNIQDELRSMLSEELNFHTEARYTELFSSRAKKKKQRFVSAPKVYFEYSGEDVLVTEFVSGVFLHEILSAVDRNDTEALARFRAMDIDPAVLARRLTRAFNWETLEGLFFHADPHPANIVTRPGNALVFIDFGSCGRFSAKVLRLWTELQERIDDEDVGGMVEASIALLEPLPPIDTARFQKEMEALYWSWLYATKSKHSEWWERCSGQMWLKFIALSRRYNVPMTLDTLRMFRATFLYDSISVRLWNKLDLNREYFDYAKKRGRDAKKRVQGAIMRRLTEGPTGRDYLAIERLGQFVSQTQRVIQHAVDNPVRRFSGMLGKAAFAASMTMRGIAAAFGFHALILGVLVVASRLQTGEADPVALLVGLLKHPLYQAFAALVLLVAMRKVNMRFEDLDVEKG